MITFENNGVVHDIIYKIMKWAMMSFEKFRVLQAEEAIF